jgi:hypothetical protein
VPISTPAYHVALVVPDLERATSELTAALGFSWAGVQRRTNTFESPDGPTRVDMCFVYSLEGPPYLEIIEQREGSIFAASGLHHLGVWCDGRSAESARLDGLGWPRETVGLAPDGSWAGGLFHLVAGMRVEVVDIGRSGPPLCRYLAGGDYR